MWQGKCEHSVKYANETGGFTYARSVHINASETKRVWCLKKIKKIKYPCSLAYYTVTHACECACKQ